jgi:hypothetical protein
MLWAPMSIDLFSVLVPTIAGLAGAGVGGVASYLAATGAAKTAARNEQRVWIRERRETAYLALLSTFESWRDLQVAVLTETAGWEGSGVGERPMLFGVDGELMSSLREAVDKVELFGSVRAAHIARTWLADVSAYRDETAREDFNTLLRDAAKPAAQRDAFVALIREELSIGS